MVFTGFRSAMQSSLLAPLRECRAVSATKQRYGQAMGAVPVPTHAFRRAACLSLTNYRENT